MIKKIKKIKIIKKETPFNGKILRDLSSNPDFTLAKFKKRFNLK